MVAPDPVAFSIFGFDVMWYGVLIGIGIILACSILYVRAPKYGYDSDKILDVLIISILVGIIGARAYYVAFNWNSYAGDIVKILNIRGGGLAIHGGLIFGIVCAVLLCRKWNINIKGLMDLAAPSIAFAQSIGRWGNFFNEEAHGGLTYFPINVLIDGKTYHATFLYESLWCFLLFLFLLYFTKRRKFEGQIFLLYAMLYSVERFFVEGLRTDSLMIGPFRQAQLISVVIFAGALALYIVLRRRCCAQGKSADK